MARKKQRPEKFIKDIVIAGERWKALLPLGGGVESQPNAGLVLAPVITNALKTGVALAAVPERRRRSKAHTFDAKGKPVHPLGFCYLVSLASLKTQTRFEKVVGAGGPERRRPPGDAVHLQPTSLHRRSAWRATPE